MLEQITENEQERLFELERKDQENVQMQRYVEKMMDEDRVQLEKRKDEQAALRVTTYHVYFLSHNTVSSTLNDKAFKNIVGIGENDGKAAFSPFLTMFSTVSNEEITQGTDRFFTGKQLVGLQRVAFMVFVKKNYKPATLLKHV